MSGPGEDHIVFTIGHSNHSLEHFTRLLGKHGIGTLADVRSHPYSRYVPHFTAVPLRQALEGEGIRYVYLGRELGGRPAARDFYDEKARVLCNRLRQSAVFAEGMSSLLVDVSNARVAVICGEEDPLACHHWLLVGQALAERGARCRAGLPFLKMDRIICLFRNSVQLLEENLHGLGRKEFLMP